MWLEKTGASIYPVVKRFRINLSACINKSKSLVTSLHRSLLLMMGILALTGWVLAGMLWHADLATRDAEPVQAEATPPAQQKTVPIGRPYLGIRGEAFKQGNLTGLRILEVFPGSPAAISGLRSRNDPLRSIGDLIIKVNDLAIKSEEDFRLLMQKSVPGNVLNFLITSDGAESYEIIPVTLGAVPGTTNTGNIKDDQNSATSQGSNSATQLEEAILSQVNRVRAEYGLDALRSNSLLQEAARSHSEQMANQNFFSHIDPKGRDVVDRIHSQGVESFKSVGENIFVGQNLANLVDSIIQGWVASPGHKRNLLSSDYREAGTGVAVSNKQKFYVTQVYLEPR